MPAAGRPERKQGRSSSLRRQRPAVTREPGLQSLATWRPHPPSPPAARSAARPAATAATRSRALPASAAASARASRTAAQAGVPRLPGAATPSATTAARSTATLCAAAMGEDLRRGTRWAAAAARSSSSSRSLVFVLIVFLLFLLLGWMRRHSYVVIGTPAPGYHPEVKPGSPARAGAPLPAPLRSAVCRNRRWSGRGPRERASCSPSSAAADSNRRSDGMRVGAHSGGRI